MGLWGDDDVVDLNPGGDGRGDSVLSADVAVRALPRIFAQHREQMPADVQAPSLDGLTIVVPELEAPTEEELQERFEELVIERAPTRRKARGEKLELGDRVFAHVLTFADGQLVPHLSGANNRVWLDPESMVPGLAEALLKAKVGESIRASVMLPKDEEELEPLAGVPLVMAVQVAGADKVELPKTAVDSPETLRALGLNEDLDTLFEALAEQLLEEREAIAQREVIEQIYDQLIARAPVDLSDELLDQVSGKLWFEQQGQFLAQMNVTDADREQAASIWLADDSTRAEVKRMVQATLLVNAIADREKVTVDVKQDVPEFVRGLADALDLDADKMVEEAKADPKIAWDAASQLRYLETLELIISKAKVENAPPEA